MHNPTARADNISVLNILAVSQDPNSLSELEGKINFLTLLSHPQEMLKEFKTKKYNLILLDISIEKNRPKLITDIRNYDQNIPIILISTKEDNGDLFELINLRISYTLQKPFNNEELLQGITKVLRHSHFLNTSKNSYQDIQEQRAFLKEHQVIKNDYYYKYHTNSNDNTLWYIDGSYRPHDILSGDTYSIRSLNDETCFFFIIDAMGKGVSASVTSIVASSFINHLVDVLEDDFDFAVFVEKFNIYMSKNLLEEEVLSVVFAQLDFKNETLEVSSYGMPPILLCDENNELIKIKTNNQPISKYNSNFNINIHSMKNIKKALFCSDGLVESHLENGELYFSHLKQDFQNSSSRSSFLKKVYNKILHPDDDITLLFFQKIKHTEKIDIKIESKTKLKDLEEIITGFHTFLTDNGVDHIHTAKLGMIFTEMIMNAYEHGNLNINAAEKKELIHKGELNDECQKRESLYAHRRIYINYGISPHGEGKDLQFDIKDEGDGFDTQIFKKLVFDQNSVNGRGFKIAKKMVDAIYYSQKGNHVILHKYIPKEF